VRDGEVFDREFANIAVLFSKELQQEFDTITITAECVRTESPLARQVVDEEAMQQGGKGYGFWLAHTAPPFANNGAKC